jgi:hypothetical protein
MRKSKGPKDSPHVRIYFAEMESEAFKAMSVEAIYIFLEMKREHRGRPDNRFSLPYSEIQKRRAMHRTKISQGLFEVEEFGFIDRPVQGGLHKEANVYSLSERWKDISKDPELLAQSKQKIENWMKSRRNKNRNAPYLANYKAVQTHVLERRKKRASTGTDA